MISYRVAAYATPLRVVRASQSGRSNRADDEQPTQYMKLHSLGLLAELMRRSELRTLEQVRAVQTRTWALDVRLDGLAGITFDSAPEFGITAD